ncbi:hypothetical protein BaRGS_00009238 [Batillaria attramentaria]|uniref:Uncharacterized protein n=1 Tax=Batillaria attramentaria TaxID=370345 RepID=A0ABD0LJ87_9CAEN
MGLTQLAGFVFPGLTITKPAQSLPNRPTEIEDNWLPGIVSNLITPDPARPLPSTPQSRLTLVTKEVGNGPWLTGPSSGRCAPFLVTTVHHGHTVMISCARSDNHNQPLRQTPLSMDIRVFEAHAYTSVKLFRQPEHDSLSKDRPLYMELSLKRRLHLHRHEFSALR